LRVPGGNIPPAILPNNAVVNGVVLDGFNTPVHPDANIGAIFNID
jgi:hypothetical protein